MPMYNSIEYSDNYSKTSGSLGKYYRDEPDLNDISAMENLPGNSALLKSKVNVLMTKKARATGNTKYIKIAVPLKYLRVIFGELLKCL